MCSVVRKGGEYPPWFERLVWGSLSFWISPGCVALTVRFFLFKLYSHVYPKASHPPPPLNLLRTLLWLQASTFFEDPPPPLFQVVFFLYFFPPSFTDLFTPVTRSFDEDLLLQL